MRSDATFVELIEGWDRDASAELSADTLEVRLPLESAAKLEALAELFPLRTREQLVTELLGTALDEVVASFPYQQGDKVIARDEEGDPIYEDVGYTPRFLDAVHRHIERLRGGAAPSGTPDDAVS